MSHASSDPPGPAPAPDPLVAQRLAQERDQELRRLDDLTAQFNDIAAASASSNADDEHDPEGSTIAFERSAVSALIDQVRRHLSELDAAETRLHLGSYGRCEACGTPISVARLEARPVARTCIACASGSR